MAESGRSPAPGPVRHGYFARFFIAAPPNPTRLPSSTGRKSFAIRLRRHRRARRYTLRIHPSDREAILTMPPRGTTRRCEGFCAVARRLDRGALWVVLPKAAPFQAGTVLPLRGVPHQHRASRRRVAAPCGPKPATAARKCCAWPEAPSTWNGACSIISSARRARIYRRHRWHYALPSSASGSSGYRSAISRAAGGHAPRPGRCRSRGG